MSSNQSFPPVQQRLEQFLRKHCQVEPDASEVSRLAGDASARQYYRCTLPKNLSYILVAYPEPFRLVSFDYGHIYALFRDIGIPVPETVAIDERLGMVLQEDLGDTSLMELLEQVEEKRKKAFLKKAVSYIVKVQEEGSKGLKPFYRADKLAFDMGKLLWELNFFQEHYLEGYSGTEVRNRAALLDEFERISVELAEFPRVLCHRDFQVRNIMVKGDVLYVIDFQDARWGPPAYDLASLLRDSLELSSEMVEGLVDCYLEEIQVRRPLGISREVFAKNVFSRQFHLACIQRLLKALGTYGFQVSIRGKRRYVKFIKGTLDRVLVSLRQIPEFPEIGSTVEQALRRI